MPVRRVRSRDFWPEPGRLLADAKAAEDHAEQVLGVDATGDFAEGIECRAEVDRCQLGTALAIAENLKRGAEFVAGEREACLMACVDRNRLIAPIGIADMECFADRERKFIEARALQA